MLHKRKQFWINLCLLNLCIVALFGALLRSKILFSIPFIDYRNILSAHSHFAFTGWAGLSLITLFIYEILPEASFRKRIYQWCLIGTQVSAVGMAATFPVWGYTAPAIVFSSLYIVVSAVLTPVFIKDLMRHRVQKAVRLLSISALASLVLSAIGPALLVYILVSKSGDSILYRDSVYLFLHFQYNGFFTLAIFALFLNHVAKKGLLPNKQAWLFSLLLCLSVVPSVALSLLWHNSAVLYVVAAVGCVLQLMVLFYFLAWMKTLNKEILFSEPMARTLWLLAAFSFGLKMLLSIGTIVPELSHAVYGDRPVIIGFLHLVFLGFLTFYILAALVEYGYFKKLGKTVAYPFVVFGTGIIANEVLLMLQGLGNLLKTTTSMFNWLLWGGSLLLFAGAVLLAAVRLRSAGVQQME
jgi:hypothetical protein